MNSAHKKECLTIFEEISGREEKFTARELREHVSSPTLFYYLFDGGHLKVSSTGKNKTLLRNFYDLYEAAENNVTLETRVALRKVYVSHKNYMKACLLIHLISTQVLSNDPYREKLSHGMHSFFPVTYLDVSQVKMNMLWIEKMFIDQVEAEKVLLAATRQLRIQSEEEYVDVRNNINSLPAEWLTEFYPSLSTEGSW